MAVSRAYFIVVIPAIAVGVFYVAIFRSLGFAISAAPFAGAAALLAGALIGVARHQRRRQKRRGG